MRGGAGRTRIGNQTVKECGSSPTSPPRIRAQPEISPFVEMLINSGTLRTRVHGVRQGELAGHYETDFKTITRPNTTTPTSTAEKIACCLRLREMILRARAESDATCGGPSLSIAATIAWNT